MIAAAPRYLLVGIACALLHNAIMIGGDMLGMHYVASNLVSYVAVVLAGYGLHSTFTFRRSMSISSLVRYAVGMATNLPGSVLSMFVLCDLFGLAVVVAAPVTTALLFVWNFATSRWAIVGRRTLQKPA